MGKHRQGHVPIPAGVLPELRVVQPGFTCGGLEVFLDGQRVLTIRARLISVTFFGTPHEVGHNGEDPSGSYPYPTSDFSRGDACRQFGNSGEHVVGGECY